MKGVHDNVLLCIQNEEEIDKELMQKETKIHQLEQQVNTEPYLPLRHILNTIIVLAC